MQVRRSFPTRGALRRPRLRPLDLVVGAGIIGIFYVVVRLAGSMTTAFPARSANTISTNPSHLPYYAARSLLRMFIALAISIAFTFTASPIHSRNSCFVPATATGSYPRPSSGFVRLCCLSMAQNHFAQEG